MKKIFISHIALEAELAMVLKEQIELAFPKNKIHAFVSSSPDDVAAGDNWLNLTKDALKSSTALLILCSRISIYSPWVFFEAGYGWSHDLQVLPICHGSQDKGKLPLPLGLFQSLQVSNIKFPEELSARLSKILRLTRSRRTDYAEMARKLVAAAQAVALKVKVLEKIKTEVWVNNTALKLASKVGVSEIAMNSHLDFLVDAGYAKKARSGLKDTYGHSLTGKGKRLLQQGYNY